MMDDCVLRYRREGVEAQSQMHDEEVSRKWQAQPKHRQNRTAGHSRGN